MFSHVTIGTQDLPRAEAFYDAALAPLGILRVPGKFAGWASWQRPGEASKLWVGKPQTASRRAMAMVGWWPSPCPRARL